MRYAVIVLFFAFVCTGCASWEQYDSVRLQAGIQIPIPFYEVNVGFNLELKDKAVVEKELRRRIKYVDAYADFEAWLRRREQNEVSGD